MPYGWGATWGYLWGDPGYWTFRGTVTCTPKIPVASVASLPARRAASVASVPKISAMSVACLPARRVATVASVPNIGAVGVNGGYGLGSFGSTGNLTPAITSMPCIEGPLTVTSM